MNRRLSPGSFSGGQRKRSEQGDLPRATARQTEQDATTHLEIQTLHYYRLWDALRLCVFLLIALHAGGRSGMPHRFQQPHAGTVAGVTRGAQALRARPEEPFRAAPGAVLPRMHV